MTQSGQLMPAPLGKDSLLPPNPAPQGQGLPELLCPRKEHPPLPGHSPGWLSALFLALWKGLFFFLFPWKGKHSPATLRVTLDPLPHKNRLSPSPCRDPLFCPCPDPSLLGHQEPPPLSGSLPRSSGSSWTQRVCRGRGVGQGGRPRATAHSFVPWGEGGSPPFYQREIGPLWD